MPRFKAFIEEVRIDKDTEIGEFKAKDEKTALTDAYMELGLHWQRLIVPETTVVTLKLRKVV